MQPDPRRVVIESCHPVVDGGLFAAKATVDLPLRVSAAVFADGHDSLLAWVRYGRPAKATELHRLPAGWQEIPLQRGFDDIWSAWITPRRAGPLAFEVLACIDVYGSLLHSLEVKFRNGDHVSVELEEAARQAEIRLRDAKIRAHDRRALTTLMEVLRSDRSISARVSAAGRHATVALMQRTADRTRATLSGPHEVWVDRALGGFSAWYEMFPRSEGSKAGASGNFETASSRLKDIAAMGFDIVYLPPIHPIGISFRKGANNSLHAEPQDPGSPWAIGAVEGGHTDIHPDLGSLHDFDSFVAEARRHSLEVALDYALQCSPDHPWVKQHPDWFSHRPDGSIKYAENPPKKYQDIYPLNFETDDWRNLWKALRDVMFFWCRHGIRVFRVDNPHTKPLRFWEWLIAEVRHRHPDTIFLAEAFTRPRVMHRLAKGGFTQSYTYFTWRTTKYELTEYLQELSRIPEVDYFRPNFWPTTPDILHESLQTGGRAAFRMRLILAALCSPSWGMYSGYELFEHTAIRPGSEEFLDSEKYQYRPRDWNRADSLAPFITQVNAIRRLHRPAISQQSTLGLHHIDNDSLICISRSSHDGSDVLLVVVNLDPFATHEATTWLDLQQLGLPADRSYEAHDELTDTTYIWQGPANYVRLDPTIQPAHVLHLRPR